MLSYASYPALWDGRGYPTLVDVTPLCGTVVHRSVERIVRALHVARCSSVADPRAVDVLRELGGYSSIVAAAITSEVEDLDRNPRMAARRQNVEAAVRLRAPELRSRVQVLTSRLRLEPSLDPATPSPVPAATNRSAPVEAGHRAPLGIGSYPEVSLEVERPRFGGIADLVTVTDSGCAITDYKTGKADVGHIEQIRDYALLWTRDRERNPRQLPVTDLTISYVSHEEKVVPPTDSELSALAQELENRVKAADDAVEERPPQANPDAEVCPFCSVRQLCETYWSELVATRDLHDESFGDVELEIASRHSVRSWTASTTHSEQNVMLRVQDESLKFQRGERVRLLRTSTSIDAESELPIVTMSKGSELYRIGR
jgi:hypothetical protein